MRARPTSAEESRAEAVRAVVDPRTLPKTGTPTPRSRIRRTRRGLAVSSVAPAFAAAALVLALTGGRGGAEVESDLTAPALARLADLPPTPALPRRPAPLRPLIAANDRPGVAVDELEPLAGGIRPAPPGRIRIPAADVDAAVEPVAARRQGLDVPPPGRAGWFSGGPRPGEPGRAVVIGHRDYAEGPGVFAHLPALRRGDRIEVRDARGAVYGFRVVGLAQVQKSRFPTAAVYGPSRNPVLVLVTCGGPFVEGRGYRDSIIVYARSA